MAEVVKSQMAHVGDTEDTGLEPALAFVDDKTPFFEFVMEALVRHSFRE